MKKAMSIFLIVLMVLTIIPFNAVSVFAAETEGTCGDNATWAYDEETRTLTISGTGAMEDLRYQNQPWVEYSDEILTINIEDGITVIGEYAFSYCVAATNVVIPESVTTISYSAFGDGNALESITIPQNVKVIEDCAFYNSTALTDIKLHDDIDMGVNVFYNTAYYNNPENWENGALYIDDYLFEVQKDLTGVFKIKEGTKHIVEEAFWNTGFTNVIIPNSVTVIGEGAFADCKYLKTIVLPQGITGIDESVFYKCSALTSVVIPKSVKYIDYGVFYDCEALEIVYYTGSKTEWTRIEIGEWNNILEEVTIHYNYVLKNGWVKDNGYWYFYNNDIMAVDSWQKDSVGWCYLGANGKMVTNKWVKDSVGWCYVGANGYCVTNKWVKDSVGWCFLDENGRMATNALVTDSNGVCYVNESGYWTKDVLVFDGYGFRYFDSTGYMVTNTWLIIEGEYVYVDSDGYLDVN